MKKYSKILSILLCLLFVFLSLVSCHGAKESSAFEVPESFDESREYDIVFWAKNDSNPTQVALFEKAVSDFEKIYPNINVTLKRFSNYGDIYNEVITNIQTGTTPNVCITYPDHIATYMTGENVVVPLDSLMADEKYGLGGSEVKFDSVAVSEISEKFLLEGKIGIEQYALPFMRSTEACYINADYLKALGYDEIPEILTWDFVFEVSNKAMEKNADGTYKLNGQNTMIPFIYKSTDNMMIQLLKQRGAEYSTEDGEILIFNEDTEEILMTFADKAKKKEFNTFANVGYPGNFFNKGQSVFIIDSTAGATWVGTHAPLQDISEDKLAHFETVVRPIPQYDTENPKMISQGPSICVFNKEDSGEVLASWLFAQYLLTTDLQIAFSQTEGYIPVTETAQQAPEYLDYLSRSGEDNDLYYDVKISASKLLIDNIENTFITPVFNGSTSLRNAAGQLIEEVIKSVIRKKTVDEKFINGLYDKVTAQYRLDEAEGVGKRALGPMPLASKLLIGALVVIWAAIVAYFAYDRIKKRKNKA